MADTTTTYLDIVKPEIGSSRDAWGVKINQGLDKIDAVFADDGSGTSVGLHVGADKVLDATNGSVKFGEGNWSIDDTDITASAAEINLLAGGIGAAIGPFLMPVGFTFETTNPANPSTYYGFGTWEMYGAGKIVVGYATGDAVFGTAGSTGGNKDAAVVSHTHDATTVTTVTDPGHTHSYSNAYDSVSPIGWDGGGTNLFHNSQTTGSTSTGIVVSAVTTVNNTGESAANRNMPPYVVMYRWRRTV